MVVVVVALAHPTWTIVRDEETIEDISLPRSFGEKSEATKANIQLEVLDVQYHGNVQGRNHLRSKGKLETNQK